MTLKDIEAIPKDMLTPADVAKFLQCDPHQIRLQARKAPHLLGLPVSVVGNRTKIPKESFIAYFKGRAGGTNEQ